MTGDRFNELGTGSFFGEHLYDRAVPEDHFLRRLEEAVDWEDFARTLIRLYRGKAKRGRSPYDLVVILKNLALSYVYGASTRQVERRLSDSLWANWLLGLAVDEAAPDHATLTKSKRGGETREDSCSGGTAKGGGVDGDAQGGRVWLDPAGGQHPQAGRCECSMWQRMIGCVGRGSRVATVEGARL